jgi:AhpD family alkylhydroperoxidase
MSAIAKHLQSIDKKLRALIELRVSQINGCAYCIDIHTQQALAAGESQRRLNLLSTWPELPTFYTPKEQAALAWAETLTTISETHAPDTLFEALKSHFSDPEIVDLTLIISQMNAWNRLAISLRKMPTPRS